MSTTINNIFIMQRLAELDYKLKGQLDERNLKRVTADLVNSLFIDDRDSSIVYTPTPQTSDAAEPWYRYANDFAFLDNTVTRGKGDHATAQSFTYQFTGTSLAIISILGTDCGKIDIDIQPDGITETVDLYNANSFFKYPVYEVEDLLPGGHMLTVTVRDDKNASSSNYYFFFDGLRIGGVFSTKQYPITCIDTYHSVTTNSNGYYELDLLNEAPTGWTFIATFNAKITDPSMDGLTTLPKIAANGRRVFLYNGAADTAYDLMVDMIIAPK